MTKEKRRNQALLRRDSLDNNKIVEASKVIFEKVTTLLPYQEADNILIYASMRSEVITDEIILDALSKGKRVFCPKVIDRKNGIMKFVRVHALEELQEGYFGIREPVLPDGYTEPAFDTDKSLVIMPLVSFDKDRNRIGYSGGFYDRYLSSHRGLKAMAIAFECQKEAEVIRAEEHDIAPFMVVTEESIY